jgi:hypothetical protein
MDIKQIHLKEPIMEIDYLIEIFRQ